MHFKENLKKFDIKHLTMRFYCDNLAKIIENINNKFNFSFLYEAF